jgi:hypothetical protein
MIMFFPSLYPSSFSPARKAVIRAATAAEPPAKIIATRGTLACCAFAGSTTLKAKPISSRIVLMPKIFIVVLNELSRRGLALQVIP